MEEDTSNLPALTTLIVGAFVGNNSTAQSELPILIATVHQALLNVDKPLAEAPAEPIKLTAAQIRKSITPDALISFEDGKAYKTLKRHLGTRGLTPAAYKAKWGLPADYPTTSPSYSARRSEMAKSLGLGQISRPVEAAPAAKPTAKPAPARRGRPKKDAAKEA